MIITPDSTIVNAPSKKKEPLLSMEMKKKTKQKSRFTRKLCTSNEYEKIIEKIMFWFELFCLAFSFPYISSDYKNYCCALKAYEITLLTKLTSFFSNKISNNWPYFSSLVKKKKQTHQKNQKIKSHIFYISLCPQHSFTSTATLPKTPWVPWQHKPITELVTEYVALLPVIVHNIF